VQIKRAGSLWMMVRKRWMSSLAQSEANQGRYGPGSQILARYIEVQWALP
jgi:hypothetical protein